MVAGRHKHGSPARDGNVPPMGQNNRMANPLFDRFVRCIMPGDGWRKQSIPKLSGRVTLYDTKGGGPYKSPHNHTYKICNILQIKCLWLFHPLPLNQWVQGSSPCTPTIQKASIHQ